MSELPKAYRWLGDEPAPRMLIQALRLHGIDEAPGGRNNPEIMAWADECGIDYRADATPWCGLFMAVVAKRAGKSVPKHPLWARNWNLWGDRTFTPMLGDVLVFSRGNGGHVGLYVGEDRDCFHVLGGNQSDSVNITRIRKNRLIGVRNSYKNKPANCRPIYLAAGGAVSFDEA